MNQLSCIIIEDEPLATEVLVDYIAQVPFLKLIATYPDALYALEGLKVQVIEVIFLDIHLPKLKGLDFLKTLNQPPQIILTTAYHQYALESYDLAVKDYLLKPIEFSRFLKAVNKLDRPEVAIKPPFKHTTAPTKAFIFFPVNKKMVKVFLANLLYIESLKDYAKIYTTQQTLMVRMQIGEVEKMLDNELAVLRIHRSYLIILDKIDAFSATEIQIAKIKLPIGRSYKQLVQHKLVELYKKR